jgi:hypothetical protein
MTETKGYRFTVPNLRPYCEKTSFGIEPYGINAKGRLVKTGKAIIRIIMYRVLDVDAQAGWVAQQICTLLNNGRKYSGPKVIHLDRSNKYSLQSISAMFES